MIFTDDHDDGFLIDFDFCAKAGSRYPEGYAIELPERHPLIAETGYMCCFEHYRHSLAYLMKQDFEEHDTIINKYCVIHILYLI